MKFVVGNQSISMFAVLSIVFNSCSDDSIKTNDEIEITVKDAFVVGYDQCAPYHGRILAIVDPPDTVITYNFPDSVYGFPTEYYLNYLHDCLFPSDVLKNYPVKVKFRPSRPDEFSAYICFGNVYTVRLSPLIKNKQVVILSIEE